MVLNNKFQQTDPTIMTLELLPLQLNSSDPSSQFGWLSQRYINGIQCELASQIN